MLSKIKNIFKDSPESKAIKEYKHILELEEKRLKLINDFGESEETDTQGKIIRNNFETVAHIFSDARQNKDYKIKDEKISYFNLQCTPTEVITSHNNIEVINHPENVEGTIIHLSNIYKSSNDLHSEILLQEKLPTKMKSKLKNKIRSLAKKKMDNKIISFCNEFKGNEQLVRDFIFRNLDEPDEDYHNIYKVLDRLDFIDFLRYTSEEKLLDSEDFDISEKDIIKISDFYNKIDTMAVIEFLEKLNQKRFDFVIIKK